MGAPIDPRSYRRRNGTALCSFAVVVGMFGYGFRMVRVKGHSMDPTYHDGQWLLVRRPNWPSPSLKVGDVVVFHLDQDLLVKRIAALPGQEKPEANTVLLVRPSHKRPGSWETAVVTTDPGKVPEGQLYVLGDNPPVSDDSRSFGTVPISALIGRVIRWNEPGRAPHPDDSTDPIVLRTSQPSPSGRREATRIPRQ
jgi:signal peptidase I